MEIERLLQETIERFNARVRGDPRLQGELEGIERTVVVRLSDGPAYTFRIERGEISGLAEGDIEGADVLIESDAGTVAALLKKEMGPMKALALRKLRIKADIEDLVRLRRLF